MDKIKVTICTGTACYVMGASELMLLEERLPAELKDKVQIDGCTCMGVCKHSSQEKPPFVKINGEIIPGADLLTVIDRIRTIAGGSHA